MPTELDLGFNFRGKRFRRAELGLEAFSQSLGVPLRRMGPHARKELKDILDTVALAMDMRHSIPWSKTAPVGVKGKRAGKLYRRSGKLMRGLKRSVRVRGTVQTLEGEIGGFPVKSWAGVHEYGATIKTKRAKYLTVPLPAALTSKGVPKKKGARDWQNTFVAKSKRGNLIIFQRRGKKKLIPLYVLKKRVRIPARMGLGPTLQKAAPVFVDRLFDRLVKELVKATGGAARPTA